MSNLAARISHLLSENNKTPTDIEKETGLDASTIYNILSGTSKNPKLNSLELIAKGLGVNLATFFMEEEEVKPEHPLSLKQTKAFSDAALATADVVLKKKLNYTMDQLKTIIDEVYKFSMKKDPPNIDPTFIEWLIEDKYKI